MKNKNKFLGKSYKRREDKNGGHKVARNRSSGFTLIEVLLVMGIIAILAAVVIVAINPARQFAQARNSQRTSNVFAILNAVSQNISDNQGVFFCAGAGAIPSIATVIKSSGGYNVAECLTPTYLPSIPFDPNATGAHFASATDYDTGYTIMQDAVTGRITVAAPQALNQSELSKTISATR
jgi:type IV pilus assembly protein PilA